MHLHHHRTLVEGYTLGKRAENPGHCNAAYANSKGDVCEEYCYTQPAGRPDAENGREENPEVENIVGHRFLPRPFLERYLQLVSC